MLIQVVERKPIGAEEYPQVKLDVVVIRRGGNERGGKIVILEVFLRSPHQ